MWWDLVVMRLHVSQNRCQMPALETSLSQDRGGFCNKSMCRCRLGFPIVIDRTMLKGAITVQNRVESGKKWQTKKSQDQLA